MNDVYLDTILLIERLHRRFLDVIKAELDRLKVEDINNIQTLILYNIGKEELTIGELTNRGYYLGSNVSYNIKKMVEHDYLEQERAEHDKRSVKIKLSPKGLDICDKIHSLYKRHIQELATSHISETELKQINTSLEGLENFWSKQLVQSYKH
jgi:DNA-binding MarR family transcriptional regulator